MKKTSQKKPAAPLGLAGTTGSVSLSPRVDAAACDGWSGDAECVSADFARDIEADLTRCRKECDRLTAWLKHIDGGDSPCLDESQLRQWAYEATTLGHDAPNAQVSNSGPVTP